MFAVLFAHYGRQLGQALHSIPVAGRAQFRAASYSLQLC
jgi:hypothetical protein